MADRKYYVVCDYGCKFESMTKEQILTAITQAVNEGTISDIDTGFVQTIKTINGKGLKFFVGTQSEYAGLTAEEKENLFAIITNDTTKDALFNALEILTNRFEETVTGLTSGDFEVANAEHAETARHAETAEHAETARHAETSSLSYELECGFQRCKFGDTVELENNAVYLVSASGLNFVLCTVTKQSDNTTYSTDCCEHRCIYDLSTKKLTCLSFGSTIVNFDIVHVTKICSSPIF